LHQLLGVVFGVPSKKSVKELVGGHNDIGSLFCKSVQYCMQNWKICNVESCSADLGIGNIFLRGAGKTIVSYLVVLFESIFQLHNLHRISNGNMISSETSVGIEPHGNNTFPISKTIIPKNLLG
jgi:hypothetical protein